MNEKRVVVFGGGGGASMVLHALPETAHKTAVIAVTDTGRSTGIARLVGGNMPAPGDVRSTIASLARDPQIAQLLQHRDERTELGGRPFDVHADFVSMDDSHFLFRFGRAPPDTAAKTWPRQASMCSDTCVFRLIGLYTSA